MHELAAKRQAGQNSPKELKILDNYIKIADLLAILQSRARKLLNGVQRKGEPSSSKAGDGSLFLDRS